MHSTIQWVVLDSGRMPAAQIMKRDEELLEKAAELASPILHLYEWEGDSATYGLLVEPEEYLDLKQTARKKLKLARRPTGGGIIFHIWDYAFSVLIPAHTPLFSANTLDNYELINRAVKKVIEEYSSTASCELTPFDGEVLDSSCERFCMAKATKYDVVVQGKKVAGAAQRKTKNGFLHQGSISLRLPNLNYLQEVLLQGSKVLEAMETYSFALLSPQTSDADFQLAKEQIKKLLIQHITQIKE